MLGKLNSTLLISIGVALVLCAAVYYVNNNRMNRIESAINRQNQVLTSFIANVQNEIRGGLLRQQTQSQESSQLSVDVSSEEARNSVAKQMLIQEQQIPRIVVSDNEESETETEDEDDVSEVQSESDAEDSASASEAETEAETDAEDSASEAEAETEEIELLNNNEVHHIKIVDIHNLGELPMFISEFKLESLDDLANITELANTSETGASETEIDAEAEAEESESETNEVSHELANEVTTLDIIEEIKTIKLDTTMEEPIVNNEEENKLSSEEELQNINYEHLKVDELRKIAVDLNKATKDEVKKLKKPELLYLLRG